MIKKCSKCGYKQDISEFGAYKCEVCGSIDFEELTGIEQESVVKRKTTNAKFIGLLLGVFFLFLVFVSATSSEWAARFIAALGRLLSILN